MGKLAVEEEITPLQCPRCTAAFNPECKPHLIGEIGIGLTKPIERTSISYCQSCLKDFANNEFAHYIAIDNNIVCLSCSDKINVTDKEPRIYKI
jgi:uncharacterized CHY-type Zn-finger protein